MANRRMIARNVATSKKLSAVSFMAEALYYRGLPFLDDAGVMSADPEEFRAIVIPMGKRGRQLSIKQIEQAMEELNAQGLVGFCECEKKKCLQYTNFGRFQTMKKDRTPQVDCSDSNGFHGIPQETSRTRPEPNLTKPNLTESEPKTPTPALRSFIDHWCQKIGPLILDPQTSIDLGDLYRDFDREKPPGSKPAVEILCAEVDELAKRPPKNRNVKYFAGMIWGKLNEE